MMTKKKYKPENNIVELVNDDDKPKPRRRRKRIYLNSPEKVRQYIQTLMVDVHNGDMELDRARLLTQQAEVILKAILQQQSEEKVMELEQKLQEMDDRFKEDSLFRQ